jgi:hypothetical protein
MFSLIKIIAAIESFVGNLRNNPTLALPLKIRGGYKSTKLLPLEGIREGIKALSSSP